MKEEVHIAEVNAAGNLSFIESYLKKDVFLVWSIIPHLTLKIMDIFAAFPLIRISILNMILTGRLWSFLFVDTFYRLL